MLGKKKVYACEEEIDLDEDEGPEFDVSYGGLV
jgi:hypothetical protein